ncbi:MAG: LysR family transcriptional regulator [Erysipelotrichia bacterium]|nr:LysR family transcriptional regulator [Erysipelotrichia bacterium]
METKTLQYFVSVVEEGTISAAAKKLNMCQPPLSLSMKLLEEELGVKLLIRGSRKITCTEAGLILYRRAKDILALCDFCRKEVIDVDQKMRGTIHLGIISSSEETLLCEVMDQFIAKYPNITFALSEANTYEQIDNLEKRMIDVAIVRTPFNDTGLQVHKLHDEPLVFVGHKQFFTNIKGEKIRLDQIGNTAIILYRRYYDLFMNECSKLHIKPNILCINEDARTTLAWTLRKYGIGLVPLSIAKKVNEQYEYKLIEHERMHTEVALIWKENQYLNHITKTFIDSFIKNSL